MCYGFSWHFVVTRCIFNELDVQAKGFGKGGGKGLSSLVVPKTHVTLDMWQVRCVQCEE